MTTQQHSTVEGYLARIKRDMLTVMGRLDLSSRHEHVLHDLCDIYIELDRVSTDFRNELRGHLRTRPQQLRLVDHS